MTNRGMVRDRNEDSILTDPSGTLWAVADGMGGYGNGDVASDIVIDCLAKILTGLIRGLRWWRGWRRRTIWCWNASARRAWGGWGPPWWC